MNLSGTEVRPESVKLLSRLLDTGELAGKLERAIHNDNTIVALSLADRQHIVDVLSVDTPSGLAELHRVLVKQLQDHHDRQRSQERMRLDQQRSPGRSERS